MAKKQKIVINIKPHHAEIRRYEGGFEWEFYDKTGDGRPKRVKMKFPRWWLTYLARNLREVLDEEAREVDRLYEITGWEKDNE